LGNLKLAVTFVLTVVPPEKPSQELKLLFHQSKMQCSSGALYSGTGLH